MDAILQQAIKGVLEVSVALIVLMLGRKGGASLKTYVWKKLTAGLEARIKALEDKSNSNEKPKTLWMKN